MLTELQENLMASMALSGTDTDLLAAVRDAIELGVMGKCKGVWNEVCPYAPCAGTNAGDGACALCASVENRLSYSKRIGGYRAAENIIEALCSL